MKKNLPFILLFLSIWMSASLFAQEKTYKEGSVWAVSFVKVNANMGKDYLNSLSNTWKSTHDEAVKQGLILSYKILSGPSSNPDDWNIMLMTEYKDLASMDGNNDKWDAISKKVIGSDEALKKLNESRTTMRTIYGDKMLREIVYK
jgi:hypothetical protein